MNAPCLYAIKMRRRGRYRRDKFPKSYSIPLRILPYQSPPAQSSTSHIWKSNQRTLPLVRRSNLHRNPVRDPPPRSAKRDPYPTNNTLTPIQRLITVRHNATRPQIRRQRDPFTKIQDRRRRTLTTMTVMLNKTPKS